MPGSSQPLPRRSRIALFVGVAALTWAAATAMTGGGTVYIGAIRVSSRAPGRPAAIGAVLVGLALWRLPADARRRLATTTTARVDSAAPWLAGAVALASALTSATFGAHVASGSDAAGYLNYSRVLAEGRLTLDLSSIGDTGWPDRGWLGAPLGFAPLPEPDRLAPTYSPGLPLLMTVGAAVAGEPGRFIWTPLMLGALVWMTYAYTRRVAPGSVALAATVLLASSPPLLFAGMQTMSDVPAAALWLATLLALERPNVGAHALAGASSALALLVRPNLALVSGVAWSASVAMRSGTQPPRMARALAHGVPVALAIATIALINTRFWGSPLASGYGAAGALFSFDSVPANVATLWRWVRETRGEWVVLGGVTAIGAAVGDARWRPAALVIAATLASYLAYFVFEEWWYLRFYLPAWPLAAAGAATAVWWLCRRAVAPVAPLATLVAACLVAGAGLDVARDAQVFDLWRIEQRYSAVGAFVASRTTPRSVVLAVQHSSALTYYAGRALARFDHLTPATLDARCAAWEADGRDVWLVVDDEEEPLFRDRFAGQRLGALDWAPVGEARVDARRVRVYDLDTPTRHTSPELIGLRSQPGWPWQRLRRPAPLPAAQ